MKPYFQDDAVTIYCGDCREIVPTLGRFDLLLTDPPYGIGKDGQKRTTGGHGGRKAYDFKGWDAERPAPWVLMMLLDHAEKHIVWGGNYFADVLPATMKWLVWDKGQRIDQSDGELAWTSEQGALRIYTLNRVALMQDGAQHPTQKPEELIRWCIQQADPVQTILDPFAGSGTTGRAAKDLGRKAVLIEREERYCEIAARRMGQGVLDFGTANVYLMHPPMKDSESKKDAQAGCMERFVSRRFRCANCGCKCRSSNADRGKREFCRACESLIEKCYGY